MLMCFHLLKLLEPAFIDQHSLSTAAGGTAGKWTLVWNINDSNH